MELRKVTDIPKVRELGRTQTCLSLHPCSLRRKANKAIVWTFPFPEYPLFPNSGSQAFPVIVK